VELSLAELGDIFLQFAIDLLVMARLHLLQERAGLNSQEHFLWINMQRIFYYLYLLYAASKRI
jgi:hypothetical protein